MILRINVFFFFGYQLGSYALALASIFFGDFDFQRYMVKLKIILVLLM